MATASGFQLSLDLGDVCQTPTFFFLPQRIPSFLFLHPLTHA